MRARGLAFVVSLVGVGGCQGILGDFTIGASDDGGSDATTGSGSGVSSEGGVGSSSGSGSGGSSGGDSGTSGSSGSSGVSSASSGGSGGSSGGSSSGGTSGASSGSSGSSSSGSSSGSSSSSSGSSSGDAGATCDSTTCPHGCCDGTTCVSPADDVTQCGYGGKACIACPNSTYQCVGGTCACPVDTEVCGGSCVDPLTNDTYCGKSLTGNCSDLTTCTGGTTCQNGACACSTSETLCGATCVDEQTDANNCGRCAHACGSGATCSGGACQPVALCTYSAMSSGYAPDLTITGGGTAIFTWNVGGSSGAIVACNLSQTGQAATALVSLSVGPIGITSEGSNVYWTNENAGTVTSAPTGGGSTTSLLTGLSNPVGIARAPASPGGGGGATVSFFYGSGSAVYADNGGTTSTCISGMSFPYFIGSSTQPPPTDGGVAPVGAWVAAPDLSGNAVYAVDSTACVTGSTAPATSPIATGVIAPDTAATDGTNVYFGTRGNSTTQGALYSCPVGGCSPVASPTPYVASQGSVARVVLDGSNVIWTANGGLLECAKTGCTMPTVLDSSGYTTALQAQNGNVYYVKGDTLYRVAE